jgi:hypothetical protein
LRVDRGVDDWLDTSALEDGFSSLTLHDLGSSLFAPLSARPLASARVLWINARWFAQQGVDLSCRATAEAVRHRLLDAFAVEALTGAPPLGNDSREHAVLWADRYGGSAGGAQGGSGRCAVRGAFNIKGVGRTPLASADVDWDHRHGWLWLPEALREAICSEIARAELPWGGAPSIAIIDVGETVEDPADPKPDLFRRRALIVRPNFVRPAHFERSIYFGSAGTRTSDQFLDAERTREAFEAALGIAGGSAELFAAVDEMFLRFADQLGAARANKLWSGRFMSANTTIAGELADFGIFRAVPNWRKLTGIPGERLGEDMPHLATAVRSIYYYARKYAHAGVDAGRGEEALIQAVEAGVERAFIRTLLGGLGLDEVAHADLRDRLTPLLRRFYDLQQRHVMRANSPEAEASLCLHDFLLHDLAEPSALAEVARSIVQAISEHNAVSETQMVSLANLRRWLAPRPSLYYVALTEAVETVARDVVAAGQEGEAVTTEFIDRMIALSRRTWSLLPAGFEIDGVGYRAGSAVLYVRRPETGEPGVWIECAAAKGVVYPFGRPVAADAGLGEVIHGERRALLYAPLSGEGTPESATIGGEHFTLPAPML